METSEPGREALLARLLDEAMLPVPRAPTKPAADVADDNTRELLRHALWLIYQAVIEAKREHALRAWNERHKEHE